MKKLLLSITGGLCFLTSNAQDVEYTTVKANTYYFKTNGTYLHYNTDGNYADFGTIPNALLNGNFVLHSGNFNTYSPSLTGLNASGTWNINISGSAGNENLQSVVSRGNTFLVPTAGETIIGVGRAMTPGNTVFLGWRYNNGVPYGYIDTYDGAAPLSLQPLNGNVGIGTVNPGAYKLAVEGIIGARKIKITQAPWADYVFDSAYQLQPLTQVEKYIQENKHLQDVPTTAEVKKDGIDVGDTQALLLKKIEELTLYIIQQNKRIEALEKQVNGDR